MKIGFLGLGKMGAAMAANLLRAGHEVAVWNRSPEKTKPLVAEGARAARTPRDAAAGREVVISMLADDAALEQVILGNGGIFEGLPRGALHISSSTIAVATADRLAQPEGQFTQFDRSGPFAIAYAPPENAQSA